MTFTEFGLRADVYAGVAGAGYEKPTPIQRETIPAGLAGRDIMGLAQTGTGKTAAFVLPILQRLEAHRPGAPRALVVCPTRELAEQILDTFKTLGAKTNLRFTTIYGGVGMTPQIERVRRGVDVIVACPGRLLDHLQERTVSLAKIEVLVLDEADQMFDMGFFPSIEKILKHVPASRQTMLFSATMPDAIRGLASRTLRNPHTAQIGHSAPAHTVAHALYPVPTHLKTALLLDFLAKTPSESVLVFMRTKHKAKKLAVKLEREGISAASLQGNLSQNKRQAAIDGFRAGKFKVLVATDIAARGIDVSRVSHVINYDIPETPETYTHRIGRTGRAERNGEAVTFVTDDDKAMVREIERRLAKPIERKVLPGFDYHQRPVVEVEDRRPQGRPQGRRPQGNGGGRPGGNGRRGPRR